MRPPKGWSKVVGRGRYWFVFLLWRCQPQLPLQTFTGQEVRLFGRVEAGSVKVTPQGTSLVLACQAVQTNSAELGSSLPDTAIAVSGKVRVFVQGQDLS